MGTVDNDDDEKILSTCSWPNFFYTTPFLGGEHAFFKNTPLLRENKLFIRDTTFNLFANYFPWRVRKLRSLERNFPTQK